MKYRRLSFIFAITVLYYSTGTQVHTAHDASFILDEVVEVDGTKVTRRGLISQIVQAVEGVVSVTEDVLAAILLPLRQLIKLELDSIEHSPHKDEKATVRLGGPVCEEEMEFRDRRFPIVKYGQERMLDMQLDDEDVLEITFVGSGGGVRAKTYSLGAFVGADKIGLLDTAMYMSGLSGSTWFLAPWISSGLPLSEYKDRAIDDVCAGMSIQALDDIDDMLDAVWAKFAFKQHINVIDLYGGLLGNNNLRGLGEDQNLVYLSDQKKSLLDGIFPMPIYTAILGEWDTENHWYEFTPYEVGTRWLGAYIPSWSFGRKFKKGVSKSSAPEQTLGFLMGIFGSAFAASFEEMYEQAIENMKLPKFLRKVPGAEKIFEALRKLLGKLAFETELGELRVAWAQVFNYVYKMRECHFRKEKDLKLVDAGLDFNNPIFATYRRPPYGGAPDVIFVFDSGATVSEKEMQKAEKYARRENFAFPEVGRFDPRGKSLTVFGDVFDLDTPLVIYMPRVIDPYLLAHYMHDSELGEYVDVLKDFDIEKEASSGFAKTFNFDYEREEAETLMSLAEFNVRASAYKIKELLKNRIAVKRARRLDGEKK